MIINAVAGQLVKHFRLDKIMKYVFDDNVLDKKVKFLEKEVKNLKEKKCRNLGQGQKKI
tara:strand:+ start:697 stop:873 length:177 start_codon:yes stop_codon:yes gene_type:complete